MGKNSKSEGEKGQNIVIGELAKLGIDICIPLSDNLPFDMIVIYECQLLRTQVKSSSYTSSGCEGSIEFSLVSNNWHKKTTKKYTTSEIDVVILCDYDKIYLLDVKDWEGRSSFTLRYESSKNKQSKNCHIAKDYIASPQRMKEVWGTIKLSCKPSEAL